MQYIVPRVAMLAVVHQQDSMNYPIELHINFNELYNLLQYTKILLKKLPLHLFWLSETNKRHSAWCLDARSVWTFSWWPLLPSNENLNAVRTQIMVLNIAWTVCKFFPLHKTQNEQTNHTEMNFFGIYLRRHISWTLDLKCFWVDYLVCNLDYIYFLFVHLFMFL